MVVCLLEILLLQQKTKDASTQTVQKCSVCLPELYQIQINVLAIFFLQPALRSDVGHNFDNLSYQACTFLHLECSLSMEKDLSYNCSKLTTNLALLPVPALVG